MKQTRYFILMLCLLSYYTTSADYFPENEDSGPFPPPAHDRVRRFVRWRIVSRKPDPEAKDESGIGFSGHAMNLLKGGTLGVKLWLADHVNPDKWRKTLDGLFRKWGARERED